MHITWTKIPKQVIYKEKDNLYIIRIGDTVRIPTETILFDNANILLKKYTTKSNVTIGYTLFIKQNKLQIFENIYWLTLLSNVKKHYNAHKEYEDLYICLYKFNGKNNASYWLILRKGH